MQDAEKNNKVISDSQIMEPQLLTGISLNQTEIEKKQLVDDIQTHIANTSKFLDPTLIQGD